MKTILLLLIGLLALSCSGEHSPHPSETIYFEIPDAPAQDTLFKATKNGDEPEEAFCYLNQKGDTVIPYGRFARSFTDTITSFGIVLTAAEENPELIGINQRGQRLYEIYWYDNGPDYLKEGRFRILRNGKIGFADAFGRIAIEPQFACAYPFSGGKAKVALDCTSRKELEHTAMESEGWFYVDKEGNRVD